MSDNIFKVYAHISPEGKLYIGMTSRSLNMRSGYQGKNYADNKELYLDIQKYGWNSFRHVILQDNLSESKAKSLEKYYISKYNSTNPKFGYNKTLGGEFHHTSQSTRDSLSTNSKRLWALDSFRSSVVEGNRQAKLNSSLSEDHKHKISEGLKEYYSTHESKRKGTHLTEEQKENLCGKQAWNRGLSKETDKRVASISTSLKGRKFTAVTKLAMSSSRKNKFESGYTPTWINNGQTETYVDLSVTEIPSGFKIGRLKNDKVLITNEITSKYVNKNELNHYLSIGWKTGFPESRKKKLSNKAQTFVYYYEGMKFGKADDLAKYLRNNGYPKIVPSTITSLLRNGPSKNSIYKQLYTKISRKLKDEN